MTRMAIIVNPAAGDGKCKQRYPLVQDYFKTRGIEFKPYFTERRGHGMELARQALHEGYDRIVSMGGDGTLSEVVNGIVNSDVILGFIPAGSGNDFGRTFGLKSGDVLGACKFIEREHVREVDLCVTEGKYFINVAGAGFDAEVGHMANIWGKRYFPGHMAYVASILRELVAYAPQEMTIELDERTMHTRAWLVAVANARYFGGGMMIAPSAEVDDGQLDVYIIKATSKFELLKVLPTVFTGKHVNHLAVECHQARRVRLSSPERLVTQADGEILGTLPREFKISGQKIRMILP